MSDQQSTDDRDGFWNHMTFSMSVMEFEVADVIAFDIPEKYGEKTGAIITQKIRPGEVTIKGYDTYENLMKYETGI